MSFWLFIIVILVFPVGMTIMLTMQTLEDRKRRRQGLPPKKHGNIKDLNIVDVYVHDLDD